MSKCLIAEYETLAAATVALELLEKEGFTLESVSVVSNADDPSAQRLHEMHDEEEEHESTGETRGRATSLGMLLGGTIAAPIAAGTLIGPFIIAGPLVGMAIGAAIGSLLGSLHSWGVAHDVSADYEERVKSGSVLIIVHDVETSRLGDAKNLLKTTDPTSLDRFEVDEH